jgi:hypothetical protein
MDRKATLKPHTATQRAIDKQIGGNHYKQYKIQPIEFIVQNNLDFIQGNIIKYALRNKAGEDPSREME